MLVPAFSRALKDSFVHARVAGLMAFMATTDCFEIEDIATKVIPSIAFTMIDKERYAAYHPDSFYLILIVTGPHRLVRDQAFKAVELFVKKLEGHALTMVFIQLTRSSF